jgi:predicted ribosomally synthesized peptide with SipW-like signal peptide
MTTNDQFRISRRKVLAGLGTIGIASAGAGLGTTAYFSDEETFEDNQLVAGTLDMKVDWEEHYYMGAAGSDLVQIVDPADADYVLPAPTTNPDSRPIALSFLNEDAQAGKDDFWDATAIEAFPDSDNDGLQDEFDDAEACAILADAVPGLDIEGRTEDSRGQPLIDLGDVKPGDFGEVTFSFHLCDNPGYVWLNGQLVDASENGVTEPEGKDPQEEEGVVELLDEILTRVWYDPNGNNQRDVQVGELDIMMAIDTSGSITGDERTQLVDGVNAFVDALPDDGSVQVGSLTFGGGAIANVNPLGSPDSLTVGPFSFGGNTPMPAAIDIADQHLDDVGRPGAMKVVVIFTDGGPNYTNTQYSAAGYTAPRGSPDTTGFSDDDTNDQYDAGTSNAAVDAAEQDETGLVAESVRSGGTRIVAVNVGNNPNADLGDGTDLSVYLKNEIASSGFYFEAGFGVLEGVADSLVADILVPEEVFLQGTLREALALLSGNEGRGVPLDGDRATQFDELSDPENDPARDCFAGAGTTHYLGFQWWLPVDHANQVQSDTVSFDVGFYAEQCRHNDGAGTVPEGAVAPQNDPV